MMPKQFRLALLLMIVSLPAFCCSITDSKPHSSMEPSPASIQSSAAQCAGGVCTAPPAHFQKKALQPKTLVAVPSPIEILMKEVRW